jgi:hypothetical protein
MKIDIHVHTKKTKKGDAKTRDVDARRFHEIISSTDVKIVAITNHNIFDINQYNEFTKTVGDDFQIWPGIEIDIHEGNRRGHLLVIVSPKHAQSLASILESLYNKNTPDNFHMSIEEVIQKIDLLNPLYIAHYKKMPDLLDTDIEKLIAQTNQKNRVLKEATNSISAGIFISHGHSSIFGSDIQDWDKYQALSGELPDLRLPVESFEQFCLLLNKDQIAINTLLDKKAPEKISIRPFEDNKLLEIKIYNDINIFFGAKGTGKSKILEAIAGFYANKGIATKRFESGSTNIADHYDLKGKNISITLADYGIDYCEKDIDLIKKAQEKDVTSLSRYLQFFSKTITNIKAKKIKIKNLSPENINIPKRKYESVNIVYKKIIEFKTYLENDKSVKVQIESSILNKLVEILKEILSDLNQKRLESFVEQKVAYLFNSYIEKVNTEVSRKIGTPVKPITVGFKHYTSNRIKIELAVKSILENIEKKIRLPSEYIGSLGEKGDL